MKYMIFGVSQKEAVENGLKLSECLILTWANEIFGKSFAYRYEDNGHAYYWLKLDQFLRDYPVIQITKNSLSAKLRKLVDAGFLLKQHEQTPTGTFGYYSPTAKFDALFVVSHDTNNQKDVVYKTHPIKIQGDKTHPVKKQAGTEKKQAGTEKKQAIPFNNTLKNNTPPPISPKTDPLKNLKKEEEEVFHFLYKTLGLCKDKNRLIKISTSLSADTVKTLYLKTKKDIEEKTVNHIGVLLHRLENHKKSAISYKPETQAERIKKTQERDRQEKMREPKNVLDTPEGREELKTLFAGVGIRTDEQL